MNICGDGKIQAVNQALLILNAITVVLKVAQITLSK